MQPYKSILLITITFSILLLSACGHNKAVDMTAGKTASMQIGKVEEKSLSSVIKLPGQLKPFEEVSIYPKVSSFVKEVNVDRGSVVHKGAVLMILEAPELESQLQSARSKFAQAEEMYNSTKDKFDRLYMASKTAGSVSLYEVENARSRMKADSAVMLAEKANVSSLETMRDYLTVKAPFDGVITERNVHPGALVGPNSKSSDLPMLILQQQSKLRLEVFIPEFYAGKVDLKNSVKYQLNAFPNKMFDGTISRSSNSLSSSIRSEAVELDINNTSKNLKSGMYAEVKIPLLSDLKSLTVPSKAIVTSTEKKYVITVENGKAHLVDIKEGLVQGNMTEVFGDLKPDTKIIVNAGDELREGTIIN